MIYKPYYKNETIDTAAESIIHSGTTLMKPELILNFLENIILELQNNKFAGLMLVHYFDASKKSNRKAGVNDFINYLNINRHPSRDDRLI